MIARPSGWGANARTSGATSDRPWSAQPELADDRRTEPPDRLGDGRRTDAWRQLDRVGDPADPVAPLDDEDPDAGPGEIGRRDEAVVTGADDDRVVRGDGGGGGAVTVAVIVRPPSGRATRSTSIAAMRPLAPMIPPPGWVDEPHSHRSRTGLRNRA